ncbi:hypothetical protein SCP_0506210 [Sparassis crispa]|uniref:FAD/NAD(P)-binding domain-containing protein n=1 Tax=Sparassis crispa TaxID=139825 RepID=A0A401GMY0_9APHY|nr:hypothetical protein SCP_0506210 [Sparassis crispa]GBE83566.1 hypothetical protein SCP_0506210 [Sparassis crispa]
MSVPAFLALICVLRHLQPTLTDDERRNLLHFSIVRTRLRGGALQGRMYVKEEAADVDKDAKTRSLLTDQHLNVRMKDTGALNPDVWAIGDAAFINGALPHSVVIFTPVASQNARYTARRLNAPALHPGAAPFRFRDAGSLAYRGGCEALYDRSRAPRACQYPGTCASSSSGYETEARRSSRRCSYSASGYPTYLTRDVVLEVIDIRLGVTRFIQFVIRPPIVDVAIIYFIARERAAPMVLSRQVPFLV